MRASRRCLRRWSLKPDGAQGRDAAPRSRRRHDCRPRAGRRGPSRRGRPRDLPGGAARPRRRHGCGRPVRLRAESPRGRVPPVGLGARLSREGARPPAARRVHGARDDDHARRAAPAPRHRHRGRRYRRGDPGRPPRGALGRGGDRDGRGGAGRPVRRRGDPVKARARRHHRVCRRLRKVRRSGSTAANRSRNSHSGCAALAGSAGAWSTRRRARPSGAPRSFSGSKTVAMRATAAARPRRRTFPSRRRRVRSSSGSRRTDTRARLGGSTIAPRATTEVGTIELRHGGAIEGMIRRASGPSRTLAVVLASGGRSSLRWAGSTDSLGWFHLDGLAPGTWEVFGADESSRYWSSGGGQPVSPVLLRNGRGRRSNGCAHRRAHGASADAHGLERGPLSLRQASRIQHGRSGFLLFEVEGRGGETHGPVLPPFDPVDRGPAALPLFARGLAGFQRLVAGGAVRCVDRESSAGRYRVSLSSGGRGPVETVVELAAGENRKSFSPSARRAGRKMTSRVSL